MTERFYLGDAPVERVSDDDLVDYGVQVLRRWRSLSARVHWSLAEYDKLLRQWERYQDERVRRGLTAEWLFDDRQYA